MLSTPLLSYIATGLTFLTGYTILVSNNWRRGILIMSAQYLGILILVGSVWPLELAVVKLVAGWMAVAVLGSTQVQKQESASLEGWQMGGVFRLISGGIILLFVLSVVPSLVSQFPFLPVPSAASGVLLISMGLMKLGFSNHPSWVILSLLMTLSGFEVIYAVLESSAVVAGLLAIITLGLGMVGAYLFNAAMAEEV